MIIKIIEANEKIIIKVIENILIKVIIEVFKFLKELCNFIVL